MNAIAARNVTIALAGCCGVLAIAAVLAWMGAGRGFSWLSEGEVAPLTGLGQIDSEPVALPPEPTFAEIQQRPIFNEDRKPTPIVPSETADAGAAPDVPLNVTLTGIVLTPDVKLAMVQDNTRNIPVSLRVGMPLPGDQQVWTLSEIRARSVVFKNATDQTAELELEVAPGVAAPGMPKPYVPTAMPGAVTPAPANANPGAAPAPPPGDRAAELQRRIEERRREMREQAERLRKQEPNKETE
jgi:general secretion pathway protein N